MSDLTDTLARTLERVKQDLRPPTPKINFREPMRAWDHHSEQDSCMSCGHEVDRETCWCGSGPHGYDDYTGHPFVPMGCTCYYADAEKRRNIKGLDKSIDSATLELYE